MRCKEVHPVKTGRRLDSDSGAEAVQTRMSANAWDDNLFAHCVMVTVGALL